LKNEEEGRERQREGKIPKLQNIQESRYFILYKAKQKHRNPVICFALILQGNQILKTVFI